MKHYSYQSQVVSSLSLLDLRPPEQTHDDLSENHTVNSYPALTYLVHLKEEVARQLRRMQQMQVVQLSKSPWARSVVLMQKKDGSHRFCLVYTVLNDVTKADHYPLPRIDDLLDKLGKAKFFPSLDLASGFHPDSQEKTAFSTPFDLFKFRVIPFGLKNTPSIFQKFMQQVLLGVNLDDGSSFVTAYIDDL